jgi:hypothetical protein
MWKKSMTEARIVVPLVVRIEAAIHRARCNIVRGVKLRFHQPDHPKLDAIQAAIGSFAAPH